MSNSHDMAVAALTADVLADLEPRLRDGERKRRAFFLALMLLSLAVVLVGALCVYLLFSRANARSYYNQQQHMFACTLVQFTPPGNSLGDELRSQYKCPPYSPPTHRRPASLPLSPSTATSSVSPTAGAPRTPGQRVSLGASGRAQPTHTTSPTAPRPSTVTATATKTALPPTPSPSPTSTGPIRRVVCRVLGLIVPCTNR